MSYEDYRKTVILDIYNIGFTHIRYLISLLPQHFKTMVLYVWYIIQCLTLSFLFNVRLWPTFGLFLTHYHITLF